MSINASFWSFAAMNQYVAAIPYTSNAAVTGPYLWSNQGAGNEFVRPTGSPGCRVGAIVGQFLMLGDLLQQQQQTLMTGDGSTATFNGFLSTPVVDGGQILDQQGTIAGTFSNGVVSGTGVSGTVNYTTGAIALSFSPTPATGDLIFAQYTQVAPYRCQWSAIGDPTTWPAPFTNASLAVQAGLNDLQVDLGQVMRIAGYPLYGLVFQKFGITRASYIGGNVVFSWQPYEFKRGLAAHGAAVKVGPLVYYLSPEGFFATDGANVVPIGTATDNSSGIDNWFWANVNTNALEAIRAGYDPKKRCLFFAIPTGTNVLPDTLLTYNTLAQRWTRAQVPTELIWTSDTGSDGMPASTQILGVMDQTHTPSYLTGPLLTGYMETCDLYFTDASRRLTTGVRGHVVSTDQAIYTVGTRNALSDGVSYGVGYVVDQFSRIAPAMKGGMYTRARATSGAASAFQGVTLLQTRQGI